MPPNKRNVEEIFHRTCHDCGKPCNNYRCNDCWMKKQGKIPHQHDDYVNEPGVGGYSSSSGRRTGHPSNASSS